MEIIVIGAAKGVETDADFMPADAVVCATTALRLALGLPDTLRLPLG